MSHQMEYLSKDKPVVLNSEWAGSCGTIDIRQQSMRWKIDNGSDGNDNIMLAFLLGQWLWDETKVMWVTDHHAIIVLSVQSRRKLTGRTVPGFRF